MTKTNIQNALAIHDSYRELEKSINAIPLPDHCLICLHNSTSMWVSVWYKGRDLCKHETMKFQAQKIGWVAIDFGSYPIASVEMTLEILNEWGLRSSDEK